MPSAHYSNKPCGSRPLVKLWSKPRKIPVISASRYEQNEASVKMHWKNVITQLEGFYKDDKFWESQSHIVRGLVGPVIFERLAKIFNLPLRETPYVQGSIPSTEEDSEQFYKDIVTTAGAHVVSNTSVPESSMTEAVGEELGEELSSAWSTTTTIPSESKEAKTVSLSKSINKSTISFAKGSTKQFSQILPGTSRTITKSMHSDRVKSAVTIESPKSPAFTDDDIIVHAKSRGIKTRTKGTRFGKNVPHKRNPHFEMLYCSESVTDMIKWNSNMYERRTFDLEASDEYSKKAELLTKQIAHSFYEWWVSYGSSEYRSDIKRPKDIEDLFQVWFDEHASRGLVLDPKILPCVLKCIADYVGVPQAACPKALKRQIAWDIWAETEPAHLTAFNSTLPKSKRHIPPKNNTAKNWHPVAVPEDLKSMACVWEDIPHLTSTKAFHKYLKQHPHLPMPPFFKSLETDDEDVKKTPYVVPSDFVIGREDDDSEQELNLPVSMFSIEIKEVVSKLLND